METIGTMRRPRGGEVVEGVEPVQGVSFTGKREALMRLAAEGGEPWIVTVQQSEMRFEAWIADEPVGGFFETADGALEAARAALPEGNAVGHLCDVTAEARREFADDGGPGEWEPAGARLYCLASDGRWREVVR